MHEGACAPISFVVADTSPANRRACRNLLRNLCDQPPDVCEASTLHAIRVLIARQAPSAVIANDDLAGGDAEMLAGAIRDTGFAGPILITTRQIAPEPRRRLDRQLTIAPHASLSAQTARLLDNLHPGRAKKAPDASPLHAHGAARRILPLHIEERRIIEAAIQQYDGNVNQAARALEISPSTIYRKMQGWQVDRLA